MRRRAFTGLVAAAAGTSLLPPSLAVAEEPLSLTVVFADGEVTRITNATIDYDLREHPTIEVQGHMDIKPFMRQAQRQINALYDPVSDHPELRFEIYPSKGGGYFHSSFITTFSFNHPTELEKLVMVHG